MKKTLLIIAGLALACTAVAQEGANSEELKQKMEELRAEWEVKVQEELSQLPEDVQVAIEEAKAAAEAYRVEVKQLIATVGEDVDVEELQAMAEEKLSEAKAGAQDKIETAMAQIDEYKAEQKEQLEKVQAEVQARIEEKKAELEAKKAEIEDLIAEKTK